MTAIEIRGIDHVVLRVARLDEAIRFYCEVLGCTPERRVDALGLVQLRAGASLIDLVDVASPLGEAGGPPPGARGTDGADGAAGSGGPNVDHVALELAAFDAEAIAAHLAAHGVEAGEVARRYGARGMGPSLYVRDPEGNVVELKGPPDA